MEKLDKHLTLHYDTEEIPQKEGTIWYDWYTPLSPTSTYRTSPPPVTQLQTETAIDGTHRGQQPERSSTDYNTISYADIVKRRPQYNHPQRWRQNTNSVMEEAYHRVNRNLGRGHGIQMVRRYPTKRGEKHFHEDHIPTDIPEWHPDCTNIILVWTNTGCWF